MCHGYPLGLVRGGESERGRTGGNLEEGPLPFLIPCGSFWHVFFTPFFGRNFDTQNGANMAPNGGQNGCQNHEKSMKNGVWKQGPKKIAKMCEN